MSSSKKSGKGQPFPLIRRIEKGIEKGKSEGKSEERRELIERQLAKKFGRLPGDLTDKIRSMDNALLEILSLEILDFQSIEDLNTFMKKMNL